MSTPRPPDGGDWLSLLGGVRVSRRWMIEHTPQLLAAWCEAPTERRRRAIAAVILSTAADLESEPSADAVREQAAADRSWRAIAERIDPRLVHGPDWAPLTAALARASTAGYDVAARLPTLASAVPLPDRHPARELHWRLLDDCPAALPLLLEAGDPVVDSPPGFPQPSADRPPEGPGDAASNRTQPHHGEDRP